MYSHTVRAEDRYLEVCRHSPPPSWEAAGGEALAKQRGKWGGKRTEAPPNPPRPVCSQHYGMWAVIAIWWQDIESGGVWRRQKRQDLSVLQKAVSLNLCLRESSMDSEWSTQSSKACDLKQSLLSQHYSRI